MFRASKLLVVVMLVVWSLAATPAGVAATQSQTTLTVTVVDSNGDPVAGANITASWDGRSNTKETAANGRAFVDVEEGADVELNVTADDYVRNHPFEVEDASEEEVTVDVARKGRSTVVVRDAQGEPLEDATVEFQDRFRTAVEGETDENGRYETGTVERGEYRVTAVKPGYLQEEADVTVRSSSQQEFELERGSAQLEVTVVDDHFEEPQRLEEARVRVEDDQGEVANVRASGGTASLSVDVNNLYTVAVEKDGYVTSDESVRIHESDRSVRIATQRVPTLTVEPQNRRVVVGESTTVTVVNAYDEPVAGAEIIKNNRTVGETNDDGEFTATIESTGNQGIRASQGDLESEVVAIEGVEPAEDESTPSPTPTETDGDGAGLGAVVALVALLGAARLARRR